MDTVDELAVKPFREVVEKGKLAMGNAGDSPDMWKEAHRLVKVGERGLNRIESSCRKLYNEYGNSFILALKENEEITEYREKLTDLLWDFEDYIEADTFEAAKFQELQRLDREAAPKVYNILITMKLEVPNHFFSHLSPPSSPHPHRLDSLVSEPTPRHPFGQASSTRGSMLGSQDDARSVADSPHLDDATAQLRNLMSDDHSPGTQSQVSDVQGTSIPLPFPFEKLMQIPPRPPSLDPWDPQSTPGCQETETDADNSVAVNRRPTIHAPESPVDPAISPMSPSVRHPVPTNAPQLHNGVVSIWDQDTDENSDYRYSGASAQSHGTNATSQTTQSRAPTLSPTIPEKAPRRMSKQTYSLQQLQVRPSLPPPPPPKDSEEFATNRVEDMDRQYQATRQLQGNKSTSLLPPPPPSRQPPSLNRHKSDAGTTHQTLNSWSGTSTPRTQPGLEVAVTVPIEDPDHGLIPVDTEDSIVKPAAGLSSNDCAFGPKSTFRRYKGFCEGAKEVIRGEIGVKKTKKPGFAGAATVARCTGCFYELAFSQIESDVNKEGVCLYGLLDADQNDGKLTHWAVDRGNFHRSGINYRLRFLQKSHLPAKRVDDVLYACVFCVQAGQTIDQCDATVFPTSMALFTHLTRHPRPLPEVPGIVVVDGDSMPAHLRNDYDIQFLKPPEAHPAQLNLSQICGRPTGVARDQSRRLYGQRLPFDRSPALELCHGARVVGIEWPEKYNGEWIFAWHDGIHASAPADIITLDAPPSEDIKIVDSSLVRAKSRWKFHQKEKEKEQSLWLKFDRDEPITNISYVDAEFWCWSGTNSKGKWGIFPKVFLEPSTIQELTTEGADRAMTLTNEKNKSSSMLTKFASKRRLADRPLSVVKPSSSLDTLSNYYASRFSRISK
ncbi:hypothetical protein E4U41_000799 [Claviceps citrina]|nr:hypothetical protein E4U41_000799 [Claviceps citrina]